MAKFANAKVTRKVTVLGQEVKQRVQLGMVEGGRVLLLAGEGGFKHQPVKRDAHGENRMTVTVESTPGRRHSFLAFGEMIEKVQAAGHGTIVNAVGAETRTPGTFLLESFEVVKPATAPVADVSAS